MSRRRGKRGGGSSGAGKPNRGKPNRGKSNAGKSNAGGPGSGRPSAGAPRPTPTPTADLDLLPGRPEPWAWPAFALVAATLLCWAYLGARPGGAGPVWTYLHGRWILFWIAFAYLPLALAWCAWRRPFLQRRRLWGLSSLVFVVGAASFPLPYPAPRERAPSRVELELPVQGAWRVRWGGDEPGRNPMVLDPARRWALHLVRERDAAQEAAAPPGLRATLRPTAQDPPRPEDFLAFGAEVTAPAPGVVAVARDGFPDGPPERGGPPHGNHVVLELAPGEFLWVTGLQQGSVAVEVGQEVARGAPLGRVGWSAADPVTAEPRLELYLASRPTAGAAEGVPWSLHGYRSGGRERREGRPVGGMEADGAPRGEVVERAGP